MIHLCELALNCLIGLIVIGFVAGLLWLSCYIAEAVDNLIAKCRVRREYRKHTDRQHVNHNMHDEDADDDPPMNQNSRFS